MATPLDILRLFVFMSIIPALPVPDVSVAMKPLPEMSMFSGAFMNMLPPLPVEEVEAEMRLPFLKEMFLWRVSRVISPALPWAMLVLRILVPSSVMLPRL